ncbi:uncharacterized protein LOC126983162 [Eriocheir sinensis]|nr:uncharacterized protein LOC126983162 [Eriocheir sinensis]
MEEEDAVRAGPVTKIYLHDKYGCINYMPSDYPEGESETTQEDKQSLLKQKYKEKLHDEVEYLMKDTYFSQRQDIIQRKMDVLHLKIEWPYLFEAAGMFVHFMELTGINISEKVESAIASKGARILKWIEEEPNMNIRRIQQELVEAKCSVDNGNAEVAAMICAAMSYLNEKEDSLYVCVKPTAARPELEKDLPKTPCLIGFGASRLTATRYMLSIDGVVVTDHIATFTTGLAMLLASYYNFNIMYPVDSASTLEFIQRCFVGINPERGSKIEVKKHCKRRTQVHPRVLSLINAIADVEWRC